MRLYIYLNENEDDLRRSLSLFIVSLYIYGTDVASGNAAQTHRLKIIIRYYSHKNAIRFRLNGLYIRFMDPKRKRTIINIYIYRLRKALKIIAIQITPLNAHT